MATRTIVTVGRQYGSGGRYVARLLAEKLEIPYYDKELLAEVAKDSGLCQDLLEEHDEKNTRNFLFSMMSGTQGLGESSAMYMDMPLNHRIFLAQFDTIRRIGKRAERVYQGGQGGKDPPDRRVLRGGRPPGGGNDQKVRQAAGLLL